MDRVLTKCVEKNLAQFMQKNAIFLCERLCAEFPSEENLQMLAKCYLNNNKAYSAYHILKGKRMAQSRYLFAVACYEMDLLNEAEAALLSAGESDVEVPNGAAGHYLLGLIYRYTDRRQKSIYHLRKALSFDPLLWAAYEELCTLGAAEEATAVFDEAASTRIQQHLGCGLTEGGILGQPEPDQGNNLKEISRNDNEADRLVGSFYDPVNDSLKQSSFETPPTMPSQLEDVAPPPLCRNVQIDPSSLGGENLQKPVTRHSKGKYGRERRSWKVPETFYSDCGLRRSARLAAKYMARPNLEIPQPEKRHSESPGSNFLGSFSLGTQKDQSCIDRNSNEGSWFNTYNESYSGNTTAASSNVYSLAGEKPHEHETKKMKSSGFLATISGILTTLGLFRILGEGYRLLRMHKCQDALDVYQRLSPSQYNTGWVLTQVGRAYFELVDFSQAGHAFSLARQLCPYGLEGMDIYSTLLYHMKDEMSLSYLAQELIATDRLAPQSWCAIGNCYSLQKDHETALKSFQRAIQLNSKFTYAHTLCGHEYVALEEYEFGLKCYQSALRLDERHYNAWYGLGMIYLRQEKFQLAEHHFRMAFQINPYSSVIMCYSGATLHALKRYKEALEMMEKAIAADKKNPLPLYQKALILVSLDKLDEAIEILEELKEHAPNESSIYALMGEIFRKREIYDKAMIHYGTALDLKPSATDAAAIKSAIEKLLVPDDIEDIVE